MFRLRAKRTLGSNPPADLLFGELAYSDANKRLYIGRADGSPCTFESDLSLSPITDGLAAIEAEQGTQNDAIDLLNAASNSQADAISLLATTASTQNDSIEALTTNDAVQDTAIATLNTITSGQAATLAALAPVASSGSYSDLTGKPSLAFTYDQQAEPSAPAAGATWRERSSAGGLIVGQWEWLSTYAVWASIARYDIESPVVLGSGSTAASIAGFSTKRRLIVSAQAQHTFFSGTALSGTNYYNLVPILTTYENSNLYTLNEVSLTFNSGSSIILTAPVGVIYDCGGLRLSRTAVGAPGQIRSQISLVCRDVRQ